MTARKHAVMIKAKADNMDLVVLRKTPTSEYWEICRSDWMPTDLQDEFFLCLPQHKEACLHWLNGGDVEFRRNGEEWQDECEKYHGWAKYCGMMNCDVEFRIKPRKEKRWIGVNSKTGVTTHLKESREDLEKRIDGYSNYQAIEIEVEV